MSLDDKVPQMPAKAGLSRGGRGGTSSAPSSGEASAARVKDEHPGAGGIMERVVEAGNVVAALKRVEQNKGGPGVDGMTTEELRGYLREHWRRIRHELLSGTYRPSPVRHVEIPKPAGGTRELGIPTVLDRFVQQALLQVLQPRIDVTFSAHSHGFRPGRSAHGALREALGNVQQGRGIVVDVDLAKFFDRVNHDILMSRVARHVVDKRVLRLIRRYLESGVMTEGVLVGRTEGTPQGGPLSPLLANILLDDVDKEIEGRGHAFVRYADDLNVYVRSMRAGERVMALLRRLFTKLHLEINEKKSAIAPVTERNFLGYTVVRTRMGMRLRPSPEAIDRFKDRIRELTRPGRSLEQIADRLRKYVPGWKGYFNMPMADTWVLFRDLDKWLRRRLRALQLRMWKHPHRIYHELRRLGARGYGLTLVARSHRSYWRNSNNTALNTTLTTGYFDELGVPRLAT